MQIGWDLVALSLLGDQGQISRIFTGKRTVSVDHVVALANALGVRGSAVFAEAERRLGEEAAGEASAPRSE